MKKIFITAVDGYNCIGENLNKIYEKILDDNIIPYNNKIPALIPRQDLKGKDKYSISALTVSKMIFDSINIDNLDEYDIGTAFTTEYGAINTTLKYLKDLYSDGIDFVSPKQFSSTVNNSCLGSVCIKHQLKGASNMFVNTVPIIFAKRILISGKSKSILVAAIDEYNEDLYNDFINHETLKDGYSAGASALFLETQESRNITGNKVIGQLIGCSSVIDGENQYLSYTIPINIDTVKRGMINALNDAEISIDDIACVFTTSNAVNKLYYIENEAISQLKNDIIVCGLNARIHMNCMVQGIINIGISLKCLQKQKFPVFDNSKNIKYISTDKKYALINFVSQDGGFSSIVVKEGIL